MPASRSTKPISDRFPRTSDPKYTVALTLPEEYFQALKAECDRRNSTLGTLAREYFADGLATAGPGTGSGRPECGVGYRRRC